jgi:hypothetical protein
MVDFQNPTVIAEDFSASLPGLALGPRQPIDLWQWRWRSSGTSWMAFSCEPLRVPPLNLSRNLTHTGFPGPVGSSLSASIMNGVSFKAVARTGGQYGLVPPFFRRVIRGAQSLLIIISLSSFTR